MNPPLLPLAASLAVFLLLPGCRPGDGDAGHEPGAPGVVFASIDLSCGTRTITVSTGAGGKCTSDEGPNGSSISCTDSKGNGGSAGCVNGVAKCFESEGKGSCSIKGIQ